MDIRYTHRKTPLTDAMKTYIDDKYSKFENRIDPTDPFDVIYTAQVQNKGISTDHKLEVLCKSNGKFIKVLKEGPDFYSLVDNVEKVLRGELNKAKDKRK